ncbi:hypothetical protein M513_13163 [Trichuris suis]|uniref:Uncharacterized protein n=1 Tax=Trichuris suis TaxID=68888 RepID=A0A085LLW0_9BILA|nr:hypothetical protein M513_13163 [Trichuris suis]
MSLRVPISRTLTVREVQLSFTNISDLPTLKLRPKQRSDRSKLQQQPDVAMDFRFLAKDARPSSDADLFAQIVPNEFGCHQLLCLRIDGRSGIASANQLTEHGLIRLEGDGGPEHKTLIYGFEAGRR